MLLINLMYKHSQFMLIIAEINSLYRGPLNILWNRSQAGLKHLSDILRQMINLVPQNMNF